MGKFLRKTYDVYTPESARYMAEAEKMDIAAEYKRMRKAANERIRKLEKAGYSEIEAVTSNKGRFPSLKSMGTDPRLLYDAIAEVSRFLSEKRSTVGGIHEQARSMRDTFQAHYGDEFDFSDDEDEDEGEDEQEMTLDDWALFSELMRSVKNHAQAKSYYRKWKNAFRKMLGNVRKSGQSKRDILDYVESGIITIGAGGGLYDTERQRYITGKWSAMGT